MISILAGNKKGTHLTPCDSPSVRPTAQRTREALFNILNGGRFECTLQGGVVIDCFAGSGALGFEALSRGADTAIFIEKDHRAIQVITRNRDKLGFQDSTHLLQADACQITGWRFGIADIIFCDAPYDSGLSLSALNALRDAGAIGSETLIVVETRRKEPEQVSSAFTHLDNRHYGMAQLNFYKSS